MKLYIIHLKKFWDGLNHPFRCDYNIKISRYIIFRDDVVTTSVECVTKSLENMIGFWGGGEEMNKTENVQFYDTH